MGLEAGKTSEKAETWTAKVSKKCPSRKKFTWADGAGTLDFPWCSRPDLNRQPRDYESPALTIELQERDLAGQGAGAHHARLSACGKETCHHSPSAVCPECTGFKPLDISPALS